MKPAVRVRWPVHLERMAADHLGEGCDEVLLPVSPDGTQHHNGLAVGDSLALDQRCVSAVERSLQRLEVASVAITDNP